eukprot:CAMPEP_0184364862 /NCGR_PEP_ID=MMETSP1089-20130417/146212_1 /TAXON_ID=38269 ORGANISM="Gloeochaete wittrockiana, Strain SAG46.84" /NCGR_SAMPLE_ID=MMETSP1089 /ASSEMBLY_ACC=CAM_ASM_000445 /LENGTH=559 /DNA_ID=CAMNT_0026705887 /DNA_START=41 /DNA_END=1717 /DNA_ORIENTATION=+
MRATLSFVVLALFAAHLCSARWTETVYTSTLTAQQVIPTVVNGTNTGVGIFQYIGTNPPQLSFELQHNILDALKISIWSGRRGTIGTLLYEFEGPFGLNYKNVLDFTSVSLFTSDEQVAQFFDGILYVFITSTTYPNGAIRGQIEHRDRAYVRLDAQNTIPPSTGSSATGLGVATFTATKRTLNFDILHDVQNPTGATLHTGAANQVGTNIYDFETGTSPIFSHVDLTVSEKPQWLRDDLYINVNSASNPDGDARGQIYPIDYPNDITFSAVLGSPDSGFGLSILGYDCLERTLSFGVVHNLGTQRVRIGDLSDDGGSVYDSDNFNVIPNSPYYGSVTLTTNQEASLLEGKFAIELGGAAEAYNTEYTHYAYLTGSNVVPPISTAAIGISVLRINDPKIDFLVVFDNVPIGAVTVDLYDGTEGTNGDLIRTVFDSTEDGNSNTNSFEVSVELTAAQIADLKRGNLYLTVNTASFPFGVIRGQFLALAACTSTNAGDNTVSDGPISKYFSTNDFTTKDPITFSDLLQETSNLNSQGVYTNPIITTDATYSRISFSGLQSS